MDKLIQYYQISGIKPSYKLLYTGYYRASGVKIKYYEQEISLHYISELDIWIPDGNNFGIQKEKKGGDDENEFGISIINAADLELQDLEEL